MCHKTKPNQTKPNSKNSTRLSFQFNFNFNASNSTVPLFILFGGLPFPFTGDRCSNTSISFYSYMTVFHWRLCDSECPRLQDSTQYSRRSQQCCCLDGLHSSFYFQFFQSLYQSFGDWTERTNHNWYHRHFHVP